MKIDQLVANIPSAKIGTGSAKSSKSVDGSADVTSTTSEAVQISAEGQSIAKSATGGVFDAQKVADIKAAISAGRFQVNAEMVADGIIASVRDLIQQRSNNA
jgi:negative regulator of flagellin synthesis FlgM